MADNYGSTPLHILLVIHRNSITNDNGFHNGELELSREDWHTWPESVPRENAALVRDLIRLLVANGGDIYAENSKGYTPLSLVQDPGLKADFVFLTRRPLLLFFEAVCMADLKSIDSIRRAAANVDIRRYIVECL